MIKSAPRQQPAERNGHERRPPIAQISATSELKRWYWLKDELAAEARRVGVKSTGAKFTILDRLAHFLDAGELTWPGDKKSKKNSDFDWYGAALTSQTLITDNYKSTQNVRRFFCEFADPKFKFTIAFMDWIKSNEGKTLADALIEYNAQRSSTSIQGHQTDIQPHNQFNQYTRDFLNDNPNAGMDGVHRIWALKRALPTKNGLHIYERSDLELEDGKHHD